MQGISHIWVILKNVVTLFLKLTMPGTYPITLGKLLELTRLRIFMLDISLAG